MVWYLLELWDDIIEGIKQAFIEDSEDQQLQISINITRKDDDNDADVIDDDDKSTAIQRKKPNTRMSNL